MRRDHEPGRDPIASTPAGSWCCSSTVHDPRNPSRSRPVQTAGVGGMKALTACFAAAAIWGVDGFWTMVRAPSRATLPAAAWSNARGSNERPLWEVWGSSSSGALRAASSSEATDLEQNAVTARVLSDALPFIQAYSDKTVVIKYGGHAMEDADASLSFARDVVMLKQCGVNPVVVHGGGPQIAAMLKRLDIPTSFVEGVRVSDPETVNVAEMVLCGRINKEIASSIKRAGGRALGISGKDDNLLMAKKLGKTVRDESTGEDKQVDIGFVGDITAVNSRVIRDMVGAGIVPIIAPIGVDNDGRTYNCNADTAAGAIAGALKAHRLLLLTDVAGVLDKEKKLLRELESVQVKDLIADGTVSGGMIPKVSTALDAVHAGVGASIILDGRVRNALLLELFTPGGAGTLIRLPE